MNYLKNVFLTVRQPRFISLAALMTALSVVLTRYLSVQTHDLRVGAGFLPLAVIAMMFGPIPGAFCAAAADLLGFLLMPAGTFTPGLTLCAALSGAIYGMFLYRRPQLSFARILACTTTSVVICDLILTTAFIMAVYGFTLEGIIAMRLLKCGIMAVTQPLLIWATHRTIFKRALHLWPQG